MTIVCKHASGVERSTCWLFEGGVMNKKFASWLTALCLVFVFGSAQAGGYQDWWWDPAQGGMGINIGQQGDTISGAWYLYDADGSPAFMIFSGKLSGNTVRGDLWRSTGPQPGLGYDPNRVSSTPVGSVTLTFNSATEAIFRYDYAGRNGQINLSRFGFGDLNVNGTWEFVARGTVSGCPQNGEVRDLGAMRLERYGDEMTLVWASEYGSNCYAYLSFEQQGALASGEGRVYCSNGQAPFSYSKLRLVEDLVSFEYRIDMPAGGRSCVEAGRFLSIKRH